MKMATRLKKLRTDKGLTIRDVAAAIKVPISTYRDWEYGKAIRGEPYQNLAELFEVTLDELLIGYPREKPEFLSHLLEAQKSLELAIRAAKAL
jgi:transcriptional regulator with XRE-family HTH domain